MLVNAPEVVADEEEPAAGAESRDPKTATTLEEGFDVWVCSPAEVDDGDDFGLDEELIGGAGFRLPSGVLRLSSAAKAEVETSSPE